MKLAIKQVQVVDPYQNHQGVEDVYVDEGKFVRADDVKDPSAFREIDGSKYLLTPGLLDAHTHLREPGEEHKETIETGTLAAAHGGYTGVAPMPNTHPVCDSDVGIGYLLHKASKVASCAVYPIGAVTKGEGGEILAEIGMMKEGGAVALSDDGRAVSTAGMMKKAMQYAASFGLTILDHCEDESLTDSGAMNESLTSTIAGLRGIPTASEDVIVARDLILSQYLDIPVHICHVSTKGACEMIRFAKSRGVKVTAETTPHYIALTDEACGTFNTAYKVNPPLREEEDRQAILAALKDGTLDMVVTDHAPHHIDDKDCEFSLAKNGISGLETAFPVTYTYLCKKEGFDLMQLVSFFTTKPAALFHLDFPGIKAGVPADFALFNISDTYTVDAKKFVSLGHNTPFDGATLYGQPLMTCWQGRVTYDALA